jgi:FixJ family two-component response regulator
MGKVTETVFLVDDDQRVRKAVVRLFKHEGWLVEAFDSAAAYLKRHDRSIPGCLVLDLMMPGGNGLDLQRRLLDIGESRPIVFLSGEADVPSCAEAMKVGAVDFLTKPVDEHVLLAAVRKALALDAARRQSEAKASSVAQGLASLTARERQVVDGVVSGLMNKQIAWELGIAVKTVKLHRGRAAAKIGAKSAAELVRLVISASAAGASLQ